MEPDYDGYVTSEKFQKIRSKRFARFLNKHIGTGGMSVLDYGCGNGSFHQTLKKVSSLKIIGYEPFNPAYSDVPCETFDLVYLFHVFEHLDSLPLFFSQLHRLVKPGGKVIVICPVSSRFRSLDPENPLHQQAIHAPFHNFLPEEKQVERLFERAGFSSQKTIPYDVVRSGFVINPNLAGVVQAMLGGKKETYSRASKTQLVKIFFKRPFLIIKLMLVDRKDFFSSTFIFTKI